MRSIWRLLAVIIVSVLQADVFCFYLLTEKRPCVVIFTCQVSNARMIQYNVM